MGDYGWHLTDTSKLKVVGTYKLSEGVSETGGRKPCGHLEDILGEEESRQTKALKQMKICEFSFFVCVNPHLKIFPPPH